MFLQIENILTAPERRAWADNAIASMPRRLSTELKAKIPRRLGEYRGVPPRRL
jgi:hypothetical protein